MVNQYLGTPEEKVLQLYENIRNFPNVEGTKGYSLLVSKCRDGQSSFKITSHSFSSPERLQMWKRHIIPEFDASGLESDVRDGTLPEARVRNHIWSSVLYADSGDTKLVVRSPKFGYFLGNRIKGKIKAH